MTEDNTDSVDRVKELYQIVCSGKLKDGEIAARAVSEIESITGKDFRNTQEFHHQVSDYIKKRDRVKGTIGGNFRRKRVKAKLSQLDMAKQFGVDVRTIRRWECDLMTPSAEALQWLNGENSPSGENRTFGAK